MDFLACLTSNIHTAKDSTYPAGVTQVEPLPVASAQIQKESHRDPILSKVHELTVNGWPAHGNPAYLSTPPDETSYQNVQGCVGGGVTAHKNISCSEDEEPC